MSDLVEIRFKVGEMFTRWEPERIRNRALGQTPTAVQRITELRKAHPDSPIMIERRGESRSVAPTLLRFQVYVPSGSMMVHDPNGVNGVSVTQLDKATLFSRSFTEAERDLVRGKILDQFPNAHLTEVKA